MILSAKETVIYKDKLYYIYRKVNPDHIKDGKVNDVKELWHCDIVVKNKYQKHLKKIWLLIQKMTI